ncbi:MAG: hypothetical protein SFX73_31530 [Kofleriaceae bacterium]|nr:hypothetical protein [Kofleriaceae bacterium]
MSARRLLWPGCGTLVLVIIAVGTLAGCRDHPGQPQPPSPAADVPPAHAPDAAPPGRASTPPAPAVALTGALDPARPFSLELGRGSGRFGLSTIAIDERGHVVLHAERKGQRKPTAKERREHDLRPDENITEGWWERAQLDLPPASMDELRAAVRVLDPLALAAVHKEPGVYDGTQWVFRIQQGQIDHLIYCDNRFPETLKAFATTLDGILDRAGRRGLTFTRVPEGTKPRHDDVLWERVDKLVR